jgi:DNA replication protein DnaD
MDTIMTKVAYKINTTNPNLPNGFITDHFETDQNEVIGYTVVDVSVFEKLLQNNLTLLRQHEINNGIQGAPHDAPPHYQMHKPASEAVPADTALMQQKQKQIEQHIADTQLFQEFLAWKRTQGSGS